MPKRDRDRSSPVVPKKDENLLGIDATSLGSLKPKDLINNKPLASTVLTYLRGIEQSNSELQTENETLKTYAIAYDKNKLKSRIGFILNIIASIFIAYGVNLLSNPSTTTAASIFIGAGIILELLVLGLSW